MGAVARLVLRRRHAVLGLGRRHAAGPQLRRDDVRPVRLGDRCTTARSSSDLPNITGIAYLNGRIYYTLANDNNLYWRFFTTESQIVGSVRNTVGNGSAMLPNRVAGMFASGSTLYFADKTDGHLYSAQLAGVGGGMLSEGTVAGAATLVNSSIDWRARGDFVWNGTPALSANVPPTASATASCSVNVCTFDGSGSFDPDGTIASVRLELR